jgi:predicted ATP-grasp superfamily ATP-dependent carboligase
MTDAAEIRSNYSGAHGAYKSEDPCTMAGHFAVLIPDGESVFALSVLRCLAQIPGLRTSILSDDAWAPIRFSRYHTHFCSQRRDNTDEERVEAFYQIVKRTQADILLPVDQRTIRLLSVHAATLAPCTALVPLPETDAFDIAANKWLLAEFLTKHNLPYPPTILYQTHPECDQHLSALPFPVLLKPTHGSYGQGIKKFDTPSALRKFLQTPLDAGAWIIQSFIRGYDIDCSVLCQEGNILAYTIQKGFLEGYHPFAAPAGIEFLYDDETYDMVRRLIKALHWSGIAHIDLRYDDQEKRLNIIEINPRYWGSMLGSLVAGVNFPYLACLVGLGAEVPKMEYQQTRFVAGKAAINMLMPWGVRRQHTALGYGSTSLRFLCKDPFPEVWGGCLQASKKVLRKPYQTA